MKLFKSYLFVFFIAFIICPQSGIAYNDFTATTRGTFLKWNSGVRSSAMGNSFIAAADDENSIFFNPAGLSYINTAEVYSTYSNMFAGITSAHISSVLPVKRTTLAFSVDYADFGGIEETTASNPGGTGRIIRPAAYQLVYSLAHKITPYLSFGGNLKLINEDIGGNTGAGYGADIGAIWKISDVSKLGLSAKNIFGSLGGEIIPRNYGVGISSGFSNFLLSMDANFPNDDLVNLNFGAEYNYNNVFFARAGFPSRISSSNKMIGDSKGDFTLGLGINNKNVKFDYAYIPYQDLGAVHKVSFSFPLFAENKRELSEISVFPKFIKIYEGKTFKFNALGFDNRWNAHAIKPSWDVAPKIGAIASNGVFTALKEGIGYIIAKSGKIKGTAKIIIIKDKKIKKANKR